MNDSDDYINQGKAFADIMRQIRWTYHDVMEVYRMKRDDNGDYRESFGKMHQKLRQLGEDITKFRRDAPERLVIDLEDCVESMTGMFDAIEQLVRKVEG